MCQICSLLSESRLLRAYLRDKTRREIRYQCIISSHIIASIIAGRLDQQTLSTVGRPAAKASAALPAIA